MECKRFMLIGGRNELHGEFHTLENFHIFYRGSHWRLYNAEVGPENSKQTEQKNPKETTRSHRNDVHSLVVKVYKSEYRPEICLVKAEDAIVDPTSPLEEFAEELAKELAEELTEKFAQECVICTVWLHFTL